MPSIVEYFGEDDGHRCGYCKNQKCSFSTSFWAHSLTAQDYQDLIDRGWRRSGHYCYKPTMDKTCCPLYTIRCLSTELRLRRSHKKVLKKMRNFLLDGTVTRGKASRTSEPLFDTSIVPSKAPRLIDSLDVGVEHLQYEPAVEKKVKTDQQPIRKEAEGILKLPDKASSDSSARTKKAKQKRIERKIERLRKKGIEFVPKPKVIQAQKSLEEYFEEETSEKNSKKLTITLVQSSPPSAEFQQTLDESHKLYAKYQRVIHGDKPSECNLTQFERFLVKSPLKVAKNESGAAGLFGSYHQHYRIDGKLVAVGVIDILPHCVSSVYFYYDPDYQFLSLGTYASLRELLFTRDLSKNISDLKWYYLGFYIHTCPKMRYKGQYDPSFLLCPEAKTWHPISKCLPLLDGSKYSRLDPDPKAKDELAEVNVDKVLVLHAGRAMTYAQYKSFSPDEEDEDEVKEYARVVGAEVASRMLLFRE